MGDKRPTNGSQFVYYGMKPVEDPALSNTLVAYTRKVLDALKIKHGPTHGEVMMTEDGPCLVEMNCRCAGIDGGMAPVQQILSGYSQVECALDSYLDRAAFNKIPDAPTVPYTGGAGQTVFLVSMLFRLETEMGSRDIGRARAESFDVQIDAMRSNAGREGRFTSEKPEANSGAMLFLVGVLVGFALARASK